MSDEVPMNEVLDYIADAQERFADLLSSYLEHHPTTREQYIRYLSFQYHLTKDVQRYFLAIAAHADLARRRKLRDFLYGFANEEELHYLVAANDLHQLGVEPLPMPFDVEVWHAYFQGIVHTRPFVRLGAATILENISGGVAKPWVQKALRGDFLTRSNTKFLVLHQHEALPHGDQILEAIWNGDLEPRHFEDLLEGARKGTVLYLRMAEWALRPDSLASICDRAPVALDQAEADRIANFRMSELEAAE
jgi:hypothetical protein